MALCESSNYGIREQNALSKIVVFISANTSGAGGKTAKHYNKAILNHNKDSEGPANHFELLMLKHDRAYFVCVKLEDSMFVIMKCNTVLPGKAY